MIAWADQQIAQSAKPPMWLIELSTAPGREIESDSVDVPGERDSAKALNCFLGHVAKLWDSGALTIGELRGIAWELHCAEVLPASEVEAD